MDNMALSSGFFPEPYPPPIAKRAMGQNQWYHFGVGAPPILVYVSGDWDVHCRYGILTHGHTVDGNCCTTLKPWETIVWWYLQGSHHSRVP